MRRLTTPADLTWALAQPSSFLVNMYSDNGKHEVHRLPLKEGCQGKQMRITPNFPKIYVANQDELQRLNLGTQGQDWHYCPYC